MDMKDVKDQMEELIRACGLDKKGDSAVAAWIEGMRAAVEVTERCGELVTSGKYSPAAVAIAMTMSTIGNASAQGATREQFLMLVNHLWDGFDRTRGRVAEGGASIH